MIRQELADFVNTWNGHKVRTQRNRPHTIPGIPMDLYTTDEVPNWGIPIQDGSPTMELLRTMYEPLDDIEIDDLMTFETTQWCESQLELLEFDAVLRTEEDHQRPFLNTYLQLRDIVRQHLNENREPVLQLTEIPTGGVDRYVRRYLANILFVRLKISY